MFQIYVFDESVDTSAALTPHTFAADPAAPGSSGDNLIVPDDMRHVVFTMALGALLGRAQLVSPSLRRIINHEISPLELADEPGDPPAWQDMRQSPIELDADEGLQFHASETGGGADRQTGLVILADGPIRPIDPRDVRTLRLTNGDTLTANAWTNGALTAGETIPAGLYEIVGARASAAGLQAFRLVFGSQSARPGAPGTDSAGGHGGHDIFRMGGFGSWGRFEHNRIPSVDFFSLSADTSQVVTLDIVRVR